MSVAPEIKYTDRDVREDESLRELALEYLAQYGGDFEPLTDAQAVLAEGETLPTQMIRKVLNCMRHDRDWVNKMPKPDRSSNVLPFRTSRPRKPPQVEKPCEETTGHVQHPWEQVPWGDYHDYYWKYACPGIPFEITRRSRVTVAKVKYPLATARTGKLIHSVDPDGRHRIIWSVPLHEYGWYSDKHNWVHADGDLSVQLMCKYPSVISKPILLKPEHVEAYLAGQAAIGRTDIKRCPHCIKVEDDL